jgi:hypothetical protein
MGFPLPVWPAAMTAFALELAGTVPPLDPRVRGALEGDESIDQITEALAAEDFISSITLSNVADPQLDVPIVLLFSAEEWRAVRDALGVVPVGELDPAEARWHEAVPTADGEYLLVPRSDRPGAISFYRATFDDVLSAFAFRIGKVWRGSYGDVVWENDDDRCHLVRYIDGGLKCHERDCRDACSGAVELDEATGIHHLPCGCPP